MTLKKVYLENWKVIDKIEIEFADEINIIYGNNESGKTTLLKAMYNIILAGFGVENIKMDNIMPWGKAVSPAAYLIFSNGNRDYKIECSFDKRGKAKLELWDAKYNELVSDGDIGNSLAGILGFDIKQVSKRKVKLYQKPIFDIMFMRQDDIIPDIDENANLLDIIAKFGEGVVENENEIMFYNKIDKELSGIIRAYKKGSEKFQKLSFKGEFEKIINELKNQEEEFDDLKRQLDELNSKVNRLNDLINKRDKLQRDLNILRKIKDNAKEVYNLKKEIDMIKEYIDKAEVLKKIDSYKKELKEKNSRLEEINKKIEDIEIDGKRIAYLIESIKLESYKNKEKELKRLKQKQEQLPPLKELLEIEKKIKEFNELKIKYNTIKENMGFEVRVEAISDIDIGLNIDREKEDIHIKKNMSITRKALKDIDIELGNIARIGIRGKIDTGKLDAIKEDINKLNEDIKAFSSRYRINIDDIDKIKDDINKITKNIQIIEDSIKNTDIDKTTKKLNNLKDEIGSIDTSKYKMNIEDLESMREKRVADYKQAKDKKSNIEKDIARLEAEIKQEEIIKQENEKIANSFLEEYGYNIDTGKYDISNKEKNMIKKMKNIKQDIEQYNIDINIDKLVKPSYIEEEINKIENTKKDIEEDINRLIGFLEANNIANLEDRIKELEVSIKAMRDRIEDKKTSIYAKRLILLLYDKTKKELSKDIFTRIKALVLADIKKINPIYRDIAINNGIIEKIKPELAYASTNIDYKSLDVLSGGMIEQLWLIYRLNLIKMISGNERMFMLLDEPLRYTDTTRLKQMISIIKDNTNKIQFIISASDKNRYSLLGNVANLIGI